MVIIPQKRNPLAILKKEKERKKINPNKTFWKHQSINHLAEKKQKRILVDYFALWLFFEV
jgi:hypothetical protein